MTMDAMHQLVQAIQDIAKHTQPEWYRPWTDWGLAGCTLALAVFTAYLAKTTAALAKDTVGASTLADIHHQEAQAAIVLWDLPHVLNFTMVDTPESRFSMWGFIHNVGFGPAINVHLRIDFDKGPPFTGHLGTLGADERYPKIEIRSGLEQEPIFEEAFKYGTPIKIEIAYTTAYLRARTTVYSSPLDTSSGFYGYPKGLTFEKEEIDLNRDERLKSIIKGA